jgi:hypothetical protein
LELYPSADLTDPVSRPFLCALAGLDVFITILSVGALVRAKGAVPLAFLVGGTMMIGGLAVGFLRELTGQAHRR